MNSRLAVISFMDNGPVDPGYGVPGFGGGYPSQGLPISPGHPGNALPGGGHIALLPVFPFDPTIDNSLPGSGVERPDNSLPGGGNYPSGQPIVPGKKFVVKWLACHGLILVPDQGLPETPEPK